MYDSLEGPTKKTKQSAKQSQYKVKERKIFNTQPKAESLKLFGGKGSSFQSSFEGTNWCVATSNLGGSLIISTWQDTLEKKPPRGVCGQ